MTEENTNVKEGGEMTKTTEVKVDMSGMQNAVIEELKAQNKALSEKMDAMIKAVELQNRPPVMETIKTKGIVKEEAKVEEVTNRNIVMEKAESGRGFQIYGNFNKENCKFKRLVR